MVDNASNPADLDVIRTMVASMLAVTLVQEPRRGVVYAKNTGVALAQGEVLLFLDNDVRVPTSWVSAMAAPLMDSQSDIVAGAIHVPSHLFVRGMTDYHLTFLAETLGGLGMHRERSTALRWDASETFSTAASDSQPASCSFQQGC